jgi:phosphohistidine phosphatase
VKLHLVHHADALSPVVDPQRPLSSSGLAQAAWLADAARAAGVQPAAIWHSGKLRSRQTAEAFLVRCAPFAEFKMVRGLRPDDPPEWMRDEVEGEDRDVMLVGHVPNILQLALMLGAADPMPLHGLLSFSRVAPRQYEVVWQACPRP